MAHKIKDRDNKNAALIYVALIIALGLVAYANSLGGEFIWDDANLIKDNLFIKEWRHFPRLFTDHIGAGGRNTYRAYRPLQMASYALNYSISGLDVKSYHLTNTLLHISVALSVFWLLNILFKNSILSFISASLFVVHPVHTEAVSYISGRADPLAALFMLLSLIFYVKSLEKGNLVTYILTCLLYICALLSRESSIMLLGLVLMYHYTFKKKARIKLLLPLFIVTIAYVVLRFAVLSSLSLHTTAGISLIKRLPSSFAALAYYLKLLIAPFNLHMEYGYRLFSLFNPVALAGLLILLSSLVYVLAVREKEEGDVVRFSVLWFFIALLPHANIYPINAYMAEHWLYMPSIGFFLIVAHVLNRLYAKERMRTVVVLSIAGLLAFYSVLTVKQNVYWRENMSFYERTLEFAPASARFYNNIGSVYSGMGNRKEAILFFKKAIELEPDGVEAYGNLGAEYEAMGKIGDAISIYEKVLGIDPDFVIAYNNLGNVYRKAGRMEEALEAYEKAIEINPLFAHGYFNRGVLLYNNLGREEEAIDSYKKALEINPRFGEAHYNIAIIYYYRKEYGLSIKHCDKAIKLGMKVNPKLLEELAKYR